MNLVWKIVLAVIVFWLGVSLLSMLLVIGGGSQNGSPTVSVHR